MSSPAELPIVNTYHRDYSNPEFTGLDQISTTFLPPLLRDEAFDLLCCVGATKMPGDKPFNPVNEQADDYRIRSNALEEQRTRIENGTLAARFLLFSQTLTSVGSIAPELNVKTQADQLQAFLGTLLNLRENVLSRHYQVGIVLPFVSVTGVPIGDSMIDYRKGRPFRLTQPTARGQLEVFNADYSSRDTEGVERAVKGFDNLWDRSMTKPAKVGVAIGKKIMSISGKLKDLRSPDQV